MALREITIDNYHNQQDRASTTRNPEYYPVDLYEIPNEIIGITSTYHAILVPLIGQHNTKALYRDNNDWCSRATSAMIYNYKLITKYKTNQKKKYVHQWDKGDQAKDVDIRLPNGTRAFLNLNFISDEKYPELPNIDAGWHYAWWQMELGQTWEAYKSNCGYENVFYLDADVISAQSKNQNWPEQYLVRSGENPSVIANNPVKLRERFDPVIKSIDMNNPVAFLNTFTHGAVSRHWVIITGYFTINNELWLLIADPYDPAEKTRGAAFSPYIRWNDLKDHDTRAVNTISIIEGDWQIGKAALYLLKAKRFFEEHPGNKSIVVCDPGYCYVNLTIKTDAPDEIILPNTLNQISFPFSEKAKKGNSMFYYYLAEQQEEISSPSTNAEDQPPPAVIKGGFYPVGMSRAYHGGIHLTAMYKMTEAIPVVAMAPGYIVATRLFSEKNKIPKKKEFDLLYDLTSNSSISFVLIRHEMTEGDDGRVVSFYSLYMHLLQPNDSVSFSRGVFKNIEWLDRLVTRRFSIVSIDPQIETFGQNTWEPDESIYRRAQQDGMKITRDGPVYLTKTLNALINGNIVTFSKPLIPVRGGEIIGYIPASSNGRPHYLHWEFFTPAGNRNTIMDLLSYDSELKSLFKDVKEETGDCDNYINKSEMENILALFKNDEDESIPTKSDPAADLENKDKKVDGYSINLYRRKLEKVFEDSDFTYTLKIKADRNAITNLLPEAVSTGKGEITLYRTIGSNEDSEEKFYYPDGMKIATFEKYILDKVSGNEASKAIIDKYYRKDEESGKYVLTVTTGLSALDGILREAEFNPVPFTMSELKTGKSILLPAAVDLLTLNCSCCHFNDTSKEGDLSTKRELFKTQAVRNLRHVVLEHSNEWSPMGLRKLLVKLIEHGYANRSEEGTVAIDKNSIEKEYYSSMYHLSWYARKKAGESEEEQDNEYGEVPIIENNSLFAENGGVSLDPTSNIVNLHPVTAAWLLGIILSNKDKKYRMIDQWPSGEEAENPVIFYNCYFLTVGNTVAVGTRPVMGQKMFILVIGETFTRGKNQIVSIAKESSSGTQLELSRLCFNESDGLFSHSVRLSCFNTWNLIVDGAATDTRQHVLNFLKPRIEKSGITYTFTKDSNNLFITIPIAADDPGKPEYIEGFLFFQYWKYSKQIGNAVDRTKPEERWEMFEEVLCCHGLLENGKSIIISANCDIIFQKIIKDKGLIDDDTSEVALKAAFICPNGGFLLVNDIKSSSLLRSEENKNLETIPLSLDDLDERSGNDYLVTYGSDEFRAIDKKLSKIGFGEFIVGMNKDNLDVSMELSGETSRYSPEMYLMAPDTDTVSLNAKFNDTKNKMSASIPLAAYAIKNNKFTPCTLVFETKTAASIIENKRLSFDVKYPQLETLDVVTEREGTRYKFTITGRGSSIPTNTYLSITYKTLQPKASGAIGLKPAYNIESNTYTNYQNQDRNNAYKIPVSEDYNGNRYYYGNCDRTGIFEATAYITSTTEILDGYYEFAWFHISNRIWQWPSVVLNKITAVNKMKV